MPIQLDCSCGKKLRVNDSAAGRRVRCPACGTAMVVPTLAEDEAVNEMLAEGPPPVKPPVRRKDDEEDDFEEERRPRKSRSRRLDPTRAAGLPRRQEPEYSGVSINPQIITGLLMMIGAVIWFFGALAAGWIFFYPPILFVLGIGTVIKGFTGRE